LILQARARHMPPTIDPFDLVGWGCYSTIGLFALLRQRANDNSHQSELVLVSQTPIQARKRQEQGLEGSNVRSPTRRFAWSLFLPAR
jgi:hypothetical protein